MNLNDKGMNDNVSDISSNAKGTKDYVLDVNFEDEDKKKGL